MSPRISTLLASDPRWGARNLVELDCQSRDLDRASIGGSPFEGDMGNVGIVVPPAATTSMTNRYQFRFCAVQVPDGHQTIVHAIRQLATLRQVEIISTFIENDARLGDVTLPLQRPVELEIVSPAWSFTDGNISWHLTFTGCRETEFVDPAGTVPGTSKDVYGTDSALIFTGASPAPYTAPYTGIPVGRPTEGLYTWRDMRYPWQSDDFNSHLVVHGPGILVYWCSVRQTDPATRPVLDVVDTGALRPEDRFLATFRNARYGRVAGRLVVETMPIAGEPL